MFAVLKSKLVDWCLSRKDLAIGELYETSSPKQVSIPGPSGQEKFTGEGTMTRLVSTPTGWSPVNKVLRTVPYDVWELLLEDGKSLRAADEHIVITLNGEKYLKDLTQNDVVITNDGASSVKSVNRLDIPAVPMYDLELADEDHVYYSNGILSHNTTVVAMYMLWMTCFADPDAPKKCTIASKAMGHATEIMSRIKFAYEELPNWIKPGCRYYSRTSIEFENASKIKCEATSEKTGRGDSPSFLFIDEIAFLSRRIQEEMWASLAPSLGTGGKLAITSTPNGDSDLFAQLWRGANSKTNSFKPLKVLWYQHPDRDQAWFDELAAKLGPIKTAQELNCEFLSSDALLIDSRVLHNLRHTKPISENMGFKFWKDIHPDCTYLVGVDPATGRSGDFTGIQVFEFPSLEQVAEYRSDNVNIPLIYSKIKWLLKHLRKPNDRGERAEVVWSFERNGVGEALMAMIQNDESEDGGVYLEGVDLYNESHKALGCWTSGKSKMVSCLQLKTSVEKISGGVKIHSNDLLEELKNYVSKGGSYEAKSGATDDLVSATLIVMKIITSLASYDDRAREVIYEQVNPEEDIMVDSDEPIPFMAL